MEEKKLLKAISSFITNTGTTDVWNPSDVDKLESLVFEKYKVIVNNCRFFYRHDPITSIVINRLVNFGINNLIMS